jgi:uncharacterized protein
MKETLAAVFLVFVSSVALALPTPKEIGAAVQAGHLSQAESMVREVIREKPASAKARYELGQILAREGRNVEAKGELLEAQRLDPSLKFAADPQRFRDLLNKIPSETATPAFRTENAGRHLASAPAPAAPSFPLLYVLAGGGILLVVWLMFRNRAVVQRPPFGAAVPGGSVSGGGYGPAGYGPAAGPMQNPGSGVGGALLGGVAGLAAGYGLAKILERDGTPSPTRTPDDGFIPVDSPASQPDYGAFDPGSGDSWDSGDSSSGDDSW